MSDFTTLIRDVPNDDGDDPVERYLVITEGPDRGKRIRFRGDPVEIGRLPECTLTIDDPSVSSRHCRVTHDEGVPRVEDLGSTNGTYVGGRRVDRSAPLPVGTTLRIGGTALRFECRDPRELEQLEGAAGLRRAARYVESLLPARRDQGVVRIDWIFDPSAQIGGDGFGYRDLDDEHLLLYVLDVSGHGAGSALHAVSVLNVLRHATASEFDLLDPAAVLTTLNDRFGMQQHNGLFFTMWYGVWHRESRRLVYASAGHPPGVLRNESGEVEELRTPSLAVGMAPGTPYRSKECSPAVGSRLYLYTDGVFDFPLRGGGRGSADEFVALVAEPTRDGESECQRLRRRVREVASSEESGDGSDDDFTLLVATFAAR